MTLRMAVAALVLFVPSVALADDCPAGSTLKTEGGFSWCQPSVCQNDGNCNPSEVCRPIALCVQVGKLGEQHAANDAAERLVATQRCAPDQTCPATTTCSDMSRCVSKAVAEKMGILSAPIATDASGAPGAAETKKSSCGCTLVGARIPGGGGLALAGLGLAALAVRGSRASRTDRRRST